MPYYDFKCRMCGRVTEKNLSYPDYDRRKFPSCCYCLCEMNAQLSSPATYGTMKVHERAFADAAEATGETINSTHDIDRLERAGVIRAVTNPSRHRSFKDKR